MSRWPYPINTTVQGHVLEVLPILPDDSVHCVITSPPYWGLRNYGTPPQIWDGDLECDHAWGPPQSNPKKTGGRGKKTHMQKTDPGSYHQGGTNAFCSRCGAWSGNLGLEPTPDLFVQHMVSIFREVRRVLRPDGTLWLNLGSSYAGSHKGIGSDGKAYAGPMQAKNKGSVGITSTPPDWSNVPFKRKDLIPTPWMAALAMQRDGWYLRSDVIWGKGISFCGNYSGAAMPQSVKDRPTMSHEYVFLMSKRPRYFYDHYAVKEDTGSYIRHANKALSGNPRHGDGLFSRDVITVGRNLRSVWAITTKPFKKAHFATFPPALITPMILASTSAHGVCPDCGKPWERVVERHGGFIPRYKSKTAGLDFANYGESISTTLRRVGGFETTLGWIPLCKCYGVKIPDLVDYPDTPEGAVFPFICDRCDGTGEDPALPLLPDLTAPCKDCKGKGQTEGNRIWRRWMEECEKVEQNRLMVLEEIRTLKETLPVIPATVADIFMGSGTVAETALLHRRRYFGIDLNPKYVEMTRDRVESVQAMLPVFA